MLRPCEYREGTYFAYIPLDVHCELIRYLWAYDARVDRMAFGFRIVLKTGPIITYINFSHKVPRDEVLLFAKELSIAESKRLRGEVYYVSPLAVGDDHHLAYMEGGLHYWSAKYSMSSIVIATAFLDALRQVAEMLG